MTGSVAIVGKGPTESLAQDSDADEFWTVTHAWRMPVPRIDRVFEPHPDDFLTSLKGEFSTKHVEWLEQEHDFPIYMQKKFDKYPASVEYPLEDVLHMLPRRYLKSSIAYAFAYALHIGVNRIELYGISMGEQSEYLYQRANMHYLIGFAEAHGIEVVIPGDAGLIHDNILYAVDVSQWVSDKDIERHLAAYKKQFREMKDKLRYEVEKLSQDPTDQERRERAENKERITNRLKGAINAVESFREAHIPDGGYIDRSTAVKIRKGFTESADRYKGEYNRALGVWDATQSQEALQKMGKMKALWQGNSGAAKAIDNLIAEVDLKEPILEMV